MSGQREKILAVVVAGIGDLVLASPALRSLRNGHPDAEIHLLTNAAAMPIAEGYGFVDRAWAFPIRDVLRDRKGMRDVSDTVRRLRGERFDAIVNLFHVDSFKGAMRMGLMFRAIGARERIGQDANGFGCFLTEKIPRDVFGGRHVVESMLEIAARAGGVADGRGLEVNWSEEARKKFRDAFEDGAKGKIFVGINPGGDRKTKRWMPERFAGVADRLAERYGARIVVFGGPGEERYADKIAGAMRKGDAMNLSGRLSLTESAYVFSRMRLMITNDSGPMHIAAAAGTPLVCIFGADDPNRTRPWAPAEQYTVVRASLDCQPCFKEDCDDVKCLTGIGEEDVYLAACEMLERKRQS